MRGEMIHLGFYIEPVKKEQFALATAINNETMSELLRAFVDGYLDSHREKIEAVMKVKKKKPRRAS